MSAAGGKCPAPTGSRPSFRIPHSTLRTSAPRGMTLIELLIVIIILVTLVAAAIPLLTPTNDDRRLREAARGVNAYITGTALKAIDLKRPVGVALKRLSRDTGKADPTQSDNDNSVCIELSYVEQPTPFVGFDETSAARLCLYSPSEPNLYGGMRPLVLIQFVTRVKDPTQPATTSGLPVGWDPDSVPPTTIRPGDVIEMAGSRYQLLSDLGDGGVDAGIDSVGYYKSDTGRTGQQQPTQIVARPINDTGQMINVKYDTRGFPIGPDRAAFPNAPEPVGPYFTSPVPYKILRQPMPLAIDPLQLPAGTAIDLRASGVGVGVGVKEYFYVGPSVSDTRGVNNSDSIVIMFAPEGRVSRVSYNQNGLKPLDKVSFDQPIVDNLYLMIGRREGCPPPTVATDPTLDSSKLPATGVPGSRAAAAGDEEERQLAAEGLQVGGDRRRIGTRGDGRKRGGRSAGDDYKYTGGIATMPVDRKSFATGKSLPPASSRDKCGKRGEVECGAVSSRLSAVSEATCFWPTAGSQ